MIHLSIIYVYFGGWLWCCNTEMHDRLIREIYLVATLLLAFGVVKSEERHVAEACTSYDSSRENTPCVAHTIQRVVTAALWDSSFVDALA